MSKKGESRIALVHDELTRRGGAEVVFEELLRLYPEATAHALYAGRPQIKVDEQVYDITTSFLQRLPRWFRRHPARLAPLLPNAAESFDLSLYDAVISSSSGFAKGVVTRVGVPHLCYCHTPTRYLWDATHEVAARLRWGQRSVGRAILHYLRLADFAAAQRVDVFVANSRYTQERIKRYYRRESTVIYPPIDTAFYTPARGTLDSWPTAPFLAVGRLTATKHFEHIVSVCEKLALPLVVVGMGRERRRLEKLAGAQTEFLGVVSREELRDLYRRARALVQPGIEDFGMASAEALSCGTPVIALGKGGVAEIVEDGVTGILYQEQQEEALAEALRQFLAREKTFRRELLQQSTLKFARSRWREAIQAQVNDLLVSTD